MALRSVGTTTIEAEPREGGTEVTHAEEFRFRPAVVHRLATRWLQGWLDDGMADEMVGLKRAIEAHVTDEATVS